MPREELTAGSGSNAASPAMPQSRSMPAPETVERPQFRGLLYQPVDATADGRRLPAIVVLPGAGDDPDRLKELLAEVIPAPFIVLLISVDDGLTYPESLAILPAAMAFLNTRQSIDLDRIGVLGVGLAADLVLRSASTDPQVRSVLALAPHLSSRFVRSGLMTRLRREPAYASFLAQTDSLSALRQLSRRQLRLIFCAHDSPVDMRRVRPELESIGLEEGGVVRTLADVRPKELLTAPSAIQLVRQWFEQTL